MEIEFELEKPDLIAYAENQRRDLARAMKPRLTNAGLILGGIIGAIMAVGMIASDAPLVVILTVAALLCLLFGWQKCYVKWYRNVLYSDDLAAGMVGKRKVKIDAESYVQTSDAALSTVRWNGIQDIVQTPTHILIRLNMFSAFIVPKRGFQNDSAIAAFWKELDECWKAGKTSTRSFLKSSA